jgi:transposase-like protein
MIEMCLAGESVRRVEDITQALLGGTRVNPGTVSNLNRRMVVSKSGSTSRSRVNTLTCLDGIWLKFSWGGELKSISILVAIGVDMHGYRQVLGVKEGVKEDKGSWSAFLRHLKSRELSGVDLFISEICIGLIESIVDFYPDAKWQRF